MSVWRSFLAAVLPWVFKSGAAAAEAAVEGKSGSEVGKAAEDAASGAVNDPNVVAAATNVATKTAASVEKAVKGK